MIVLYKKRNKGVVGVQDKDGNTWHTKGPYEDADAVSSRKREGGNKSAQKKA